MNVKLPKTRHYAALGKFVVECSMLEVMLHLSLRRIVGVEEKIARVVMGGPGDMRVADLIRLCKQVAPIKELPADVMKLLNRLLDWGTYANDVRSVVAHKPFWRDKHDVLVFHNTHHAKSEEKKWQYRCSIRKLNNLSALLKNANLLLITMPTTFQWKGTPKIIEEFPDRAPDAALLEKLGLPDRPADTRPQIGK